MKKWFLLLLCVLLFTGCSEPEYSLSTAIEKMVKETPAESIHESPTTTPTETTVGAIHESPTTTPTETTVGAIHESPTTTPTEATTPQETQPVHSDLLIPGVSVDNVITYFNEVCLGAEMVNGGNATLIQKWNIPVYYYIFGEPTAEDLVALRDFESWVNTVPGFPGLYQTEDIGQANLKIYFCTEQELHNIMGPGFEGVDGAVTYWYEQNAIYNANICIRTDIEQYVRSSVIKEEIYNGLGPINDTSLRTDSIIYSGYSTPAQLTETDKLIFVLLYDPQIQCGMDAQQCADVLRKLYY